MERHQSPAGRARKLAATGSHWEAFVGKWRDPTYVSRGPLCAPSGDVDRAGRRGAGRSERGMPWGAAVAPSSGKGALEVGLCHLAGLGFPSVKWEWLSTRWMSCRSSDPCPHTARVRALPAPGSLSLTASSPGSTVAIRCTLSLCGFLYPPRVCPWSAHLFHVFSRTISAGAGRPGLLISAFTLVPRLCDLPGPTPASVVFCALGGRRVLCSGFSGAHVGAGSRGRLCAAAASW